MTIDEVGPKTTATKPSMRKQQSAVKNSQCEAEPANRQSIP